MKACNYPDCNCCADKTDSCLRGLPQPVDHAAALAEALEEAMGWNWLDDDLPDHVYDKCAEALAAYREGE